MGTLKREFLEEAHGSLAVSLERSIKSVFDPQGLSIPVKYSHRTWDRWISGRPAHTCGGNPRG